jgi:hypothetical protein
MLSQKDIHMKLSSASYRSFSILSLTLVSCALIARDSAHNNYEQLKSKFNQLFVSHTHEQAAWIAAWTVQNIHDMVHASKNMAPIHRAQVHAFAKYTMGNVLVQAAQEKAESRVVEADQKQMQTCNNADIYAQYKVRLNAAMQ